MGSMNDVIKRNAKNADRGGGFSYLKLPEGAKQFKLDVNNKAHRRVEIDILPYRVSSEVHPDVPTGTVYYRRPFYIHGRIGAEERAYICPKSIKKPCPICDMIKKMMARGDVDEERVKEIKAKRRHLYNVRFDGEIYIWDMSDYLFERILLAEIDTRGEEDDVSGFANRKGGKTLTVRFSKKSMGKNANPFLEASAVDFEDREDMDKSIFDEVQELDELLLPSVLSYEKLEEALLETEDASGDSSYSESNDDDSEEKPVAKKKPVSNDDDDDNDNDGDMAPVKKKKVAEDDGEEEPPAPKKKKTAEDDNDDNDDGEDDPPKKKKKEEDDNDDDDVPVKKKKRAEEDDSEEKPVAKKKPVSNDDNDDGDDEKPVAKKKGEEECPHGFNYPKDFNDTDKCEKCKKFNDCFDAFEAMSGK